MEITMQMVIGSVVNWLHMLAVVAWIGGMTTNMLVLMPTIKATLEPPVAGKLMGAYMKRFRVVIYSCIVILWLTGMLMTNVNDQYGGFMFMSNIWSVATLVKHVLSITLTVLAIYAFEIMAPKVGKLAAQGPSPELAQLQKKQMGLAFFGFIVGILILGATSVMLVA